MLRQYPSSLGVASSDHRQVQEYVVYIKTRQDSPLTICFLLWVEPNDIIQMLKQFLYDIREYFYPSLTEEEPLSFIGVDCADTRLRAVTLIGRRGRRIVMCIQDIPA